MSTSSSASTNSHQVMCYCGLAAKESTAHTENNYGRRFYGCRLYGLPTKCNYFLWRDEAHNRRAIYVIKKLIREKERLEAEKSKLELAVRSLEDDMIILGRELENTKKCKAGNIGWRLVGCLIVAVFVLFVLL